MKKLLFIHSLSSGGAERMTTNLAEYWHSQGDQVTVVTVAAVETDFYQLSPGIQRLSLQLANPSRNPLMAIVNNLRRVVSLRKMLKQQRPDVAISMMSRANVVLAIAGYRLKSIVTIGSERIHPPKLSIGGFWQILRKIAYGWLDAVVVLAQESADWVKLHTHATTVVIIPNFVVWPLPVQNNSPCPNSIGHQGHKRILAVGRLAPQKGFDVLIKVFSQLKDEFSHWDLVILGDGPLRADLVKQIAHYQCQDRVFLPGNVGNTGDWYQHADVYVMSSLFEGFPNTLLEAMSYGLPVISVDCDTGPRDMIHSGIDGLLVRPGDETALFTAMHDLISSEALRTSYGLKATEVRQRYSHEAIMSKWQSLIERLLAQRTAADN